MYDMICAGLSCLDILVSGNVSPNVFNVDSTVINNISLHSGGDASNQAVTASNLGLSTGLVTGIGRDWKGEQLIRLLKGHGVDTELVDIMETGNTVTSIVLVRDGGSRNFLFDRGCAGEFVPSSPAIEAVKSSRLLSIGSFFVMPYFDRIGAGLLLQTAKEAGAITVADMTCDTLGEGFRNIGKLIPLIDYLMPSYEEAFDLTKEKSPERICKVFRSYGASNIIIKMGGDGCYLATEDVQLMFPATAGTEVVDTTGCGDTFVAAFSYGLLKGKDIGDSIRFAHAAAAINASHFGASGHIHSVNEVEDLLLEKESRNL